MWRGPAWLTVLRDVLCLALGIWGVMTEELSGHPDLSRLLFFAALMICPGVLAAVWLGRGRGESPSLPPPSEPSSSSPSSPRL